MRTRSEASACRRDRRQQNDHPSRCSDSIVKVEAEEDVYWIPKTRVDTQPLTWVPLQDPHANEAG